MKTKGFTLIETLISIAILAVITAGLIAVLVTGLKLITTDKLRVGAISLVNKRMEMLRNLDYNDIGTEGGIPSGDIAQQEEISLNNVEYTLKTNIQYVDDPSDGQGDDDQNGIVTDYKQARVEVGWLERSDQGTKEYTAAPVVAVSNFAPQGIETDTGGGTLVINVLNAAINPVKQAEVKIVNSEAEVDTQILTNHQGKITFPGSPSIGKYEITVSKPGYSTAKTYSASSENPNPDPGHLTILEGKTTEASFFIDQLSSLTINTLASDSYTPLSNVSFDIQGAKTIGEDSQGNPVYKYSETLTTNSSGYLNISDLEWDIYDISNCRVGSTVYDIGGSSPPEPINILPNTSNTLQLTLFPHAEHTFLVTVKNANQELLENAAVRLFKTGYDQTISTSESGQVFFTPLTSGENYSLEVSKSGYSDYTLENIEIEGQSELTVIMSSL